MKKLDLKEWINSEKTIDDLCFNLNVDRALRAINETVMSEIKRHDTLFTHPHEITFMYEHDAENNILYVAAYTFNGSEDWKRYYHIVTTGGENSLNYFTSNVIGMKHHITPADTKEKYTKHLEYMLKTIQS